IDESLSLPKHQQGLVDGVKRFQPSAAIQQQAEAWVAAHHMGPRRT
ncbi:MAG: hypothetical protein HOP18_03600, partial [Deltaproteobacteria bacterium]|nr:hypothetical protein [Deltaproteobacteria bacterium]